MPACSRVWRRSSRQKRSCCVHWNWSTFRWGRNEHSTPAPHTNCLNGNEATSADTAAEDGCCVVDEFGETMRVRSPCSSLGPLTHKRGLFSCLRRRRPGSIGVPLRGTHACEC